MLPVTVLSNLSLQYDYGVILGELPGWERRHTLCISNIWHWEEVRHASCRSIKGKVHPCTGTEALYRPYGP